MTNQQTIKQPISVEGVGLHTGAAVTLTFNPAPENHGFVFVRTDLENQPKIPASAKNVISTDRGTTIGRGDAVVNTVEHVLAALVGMDIDNCLIEINGPETPIMDGSSKFFVEAIEKAGIEEQQAPREVYEIKEPIRFELPEEGIEIMALPADKYEVTVMVDYGTKVLGSQNASLDRKSVV